MAGNEDGGAADTGIGLGMVVFDTPDPRGLAAFYARLLGWQVDPDDDDDDWVTITGPGAAPLAFQLAPDLVRPTWPDPAIPQQAHLDLTVADYEGPHALVLELGGAVLDDADAAHPGYRVYADPSGHPFCLCLKGGS